MSALRSPIKSALLTAVRAVIYPPLVGGSVFDPSDWFANGEEGLFYNFNDISTLFQLRTGATPVTAPTQPIGLVLDKRLGPPPDVELAPNNTFDAATGWTLATNVTISGGRLIFGNPVADGQGAVCTISGLVAGRTYKVELDVVARNAGSYRFTLGGANSAATNAIAPTTTYFVAGSTNQEFSIIAVGSLIAQIESCSVKEIPGNHATQATAAARPQFNTVGNAFGAIFDGVDDTILTPLFSISGDVRTLCLAVEWIGPDRAALANHGFWQFGPGMGIEGVNGNAYNVEGAGGGNRVTSPPNYQRPNKASIIALNKPMVPFIEVQVNGAKTSNTAPQGGAFGQSVPFSLGTGQGFNFPANCRIVACALINRELTQAEQDNWNTFTKNLLGIP